jgi:uncharacterized protein (TIGR02246 family)
MFLLFSSIRALLVLTALLLVVGCANPPNSTGTTAGLVAATDTATEEAAIQKLYADWRVAVERGDIPAYIGVLHPDVRLFPPGAAPIVGAAGYGEFLVPVFASATYRIDVEKLQEVRVMGDIAVAEYEYIINIDLKDPDSAITQPGALTAARSRARYFDVLRKQTDGQWGIWRHLWQDQPL